MLPVGRGSAEPVNKLSIFPSKHFLVNCALLLSYVVVGWGGIPMWNIALAILNIVTS